MLRIFVGSTFIKESSRYFHFLLTGIDPIGSNPIIFIIIIFGFYQISVVLKGKERKGFINVLKKKIS